MERDRDIRLDHRIGGRAAAQVDRGRGVDRQHRHTRHMGSQTDLDTRHDGIPECAPDTRSQQRIDDQARPFDAVEQQTDLARRRGVDAFDGLQAVEPVPVGIRVGGRRSLVRGRQHHHAPDSVVGQMARRDQSIAAVVARPDEHQHGAAAPALPGAEHGTGHRCHGRARFFHQCVTTDAQPLRPHVSPAHRFRRDGRERRSCGNRCPLSGFEERAV